MAALILLAPAATLLVNHSAVQGPILQRLQAETGLEVGRIRIHLFPRLTLEFSDLMLRDARHKDVTVRSRHGSLTLRWLPLFKKRLAVVKAVIEEPQVVIRRTGQGEWRFASPSPAQPGRREGGFVWQWGLPDLQLTGGEILLIDEYDRTVPHEVSIKDVALSVDSDVLRTEADVSLTGHSEEGGLELFGSLTLARLPSGREPDHAVPPVRFEGSIHLDRFNPAPWFNPPNGGIPDEEPQGRIDVTAQTVIEPGNAGYTITVPQMETRMDWMVVRGQGRLEGAGAEAPVFSATVSTSPVSVETALRRAPAAWISSKIRSAVSSHDLAGTLELVSATVSGRLDQPGKPDWKGVIKLSQGRGVVGTKRISLQDLSGTLFVTPVHVEGMNLSGRLQAVPLSNGKLVLSHLDMAPNLDLQLTGTSQAEDLLPLLHAFQGAGAGETAAANLRNVTGEVQFSIHVAGPLTPEPQIALVSAQLTGHGLGARLPEWNLSADHLNGAVNVTPGFIEFQHVRGHVGPVRFDIQGAVAMGAAPSLEDVKVELASDGTDLMNFLRNRLPLVTGVALDGMTRATVRLSGSARRPAWRGSIDLAEAEIRVPPLIAKRRGVASSLEFEGTILTDTRMAVRRLALLLPTALVEGRGEVRLGARPDFKAHVNIEPQKLAGLADGFSIGPSVEGMLKASLSIQGQGADWARWTTSGWIELARGALSLEGLKDPLRALSFRILLDKHDAMIERLAFKIGDSEVQVRGLITTWMASARPRLTVESSKLDITRLLPTPDSDEKGPPMLPRIRHWVESGQAEVTALISQAYYHRLQFRTLSGHLRVEAGKLVLSELVGETPKGRFSGRIEAAPSAGETMKIVMETEATGMPVHQLISVIDPDADTLRGSLSWAGRLAATMGGTSPFLRTLRTLTPIKLQIVKGRILHGTVLPKVLKILNLPSLLEERVDLDRDGMPFDTLSATVTAGGGLLASEDIVLDSPVMKISAAGTLDMVTDELDVAVAVSPLGAYSDLIEKIPLFGTLLAGDRPGLTTALFEVKGPRRDPDIRYLPLESIAKGLTGYPRLAIDVLMNTIALPHKLFTPSAPE